MNNMTHQEIYVKFCNENAEFAANIMDYKPWGRTSIVVWLENGMSYKVKYRNDTFIVQPVSEEDIINHFSK